MSKSETNLKLKEIAQDCIRHLKNERDALDITVEDINSRGYDGVYDRSEFDGTDSEFAKYVQNSFQENEWDSYKARSLDFKRLSGRDFPFDRVRKVLGMNH